MGTKWESYCKVNLSLDVFLPREDGFHNLDSVVNRLSPRDEIFVSWEDSPIQDVTLVCDDPGLPTDDTNLACKAAREYLKRFLPGLPVRVTIDLAKKLPYQAGLGGGSSNAATVLDQMWANHFNYETRVRQDLGSIEACDQLIAVAASIGSDVPLFLIPGAVRMQGRGEIVESLDVHVPTLHGVLIKPFGGVPTPKAYKLLDAIPDRCPGNATQNLLSVLQSSPEDLYAVASALGNDFEAAVLPAFPEVADAHRAVTEAGAIRALLCGSGSAVFGLAESVEHADALARTLRETNRFAWVEVAESLP